MPKPQGGWPVRPKAMPPSGARSLGAAAPRVLLRAGPRGPEESRGPGGPGPQSRLPSPGAGQLTGWRGCTGEEGSGLGKGASCRELQPRICRRLPPSQPPAVRETDKQDSASSDKNGSYDFTDFRRGWRR